jgi:hypothetical protein
MISKINVDMKSTKPNNNVGLNFYNNFT